MNLRTILAPALLGLLTLAPLAAASATAPAGGDASTEADAPAGDAPAAVDITHLHLFKTTKDYRAVVSYADLTPQNSTRWLVEFIDFGDLSQKQKASARQRAAGGQPATGPKVNVVEFRRSPGGTASSFGYKINDTNQNDPKIQRATCSLPQTAVPDYDADTITFVVPRRCWKPTSGQVLAVAASNQSTPDTYDGSTYPAFTPGNVDQLVTPWSYRPASTTP